jgi:hypothetical protein
VAFAILQHRQSAPFAVRAVANLGSPDNRCSARTAARQGLDQDG